VADRDLMGSFSDVERIGHECYLTIRGM
jgi:hypothetical protein